MNFVNALAILALANVPFSIGLCLWMDSRIFGSDHRVAGWVFPAGITGALWLVFG